MSMCTSSHDRPPEASPKGLFSKSSNPRWEGFTPRGWNRARRHPIHQSSSHCIQLIHFYMLPIHSTWTVGMGTCWADSMLGSGDAEAYVGLWAMRQYHKLCLVGACSVLSNSLQPPGSSVHGILKARIWERVPFPPPRDLPNLGIEPMSLASTEEY